MVQGVYNHDKCNYSSNREVNAKMLKVYTWKDPLANLNIFNVVFLVRLLQYIWLCKNMQNYVREKYQSNKKCISIMLQRFVGTMGNRLNEEAR